MFALLDDVVSIADDVATLTLAAGRKTSGIVTDDLAVTAEQTVGLPRSRELPVVWAVAVGSLRNKLLVLVPSALLLDATLPAVVQPLLVVGGTFLCFEAVEKVLQRLFPDEHPGAAPEVTDPVAFERQRVTGAIRTDFVLSAEVVAITLGEVSGTGFLSQVLVLTAVSVLMTVAVYGLVAALVRLDDLGEALARGPAPTLGRAIVWGTPWLMRGVSFVGVVAMWLVGGHLLVHGLPGIHHLAEDLLASVPHAVVPFASTAFDLVAGCLAGALAFGVLRTGVPALILRPLKSVWG